MSLNKEVLAALQKAGAAVFDADAQLKLSVKNYGERVQAAVAANPFHLGNDTLFENWKLVARLSKTVAAMEEDLKNVYQMADALSDVEPALPELMPALSAPAPQTPAETVSALAADSRLAATDVKIKKKKKTTTAKAGPLAAMPLPGNSDRLLKHLRYVLKTQSFAPLKQTAIAKATGIPLGSMTALLKRLVAAGHLQADGSGMFKLVR